MQCLKTACALRLPVCTTGYILRAIFTLTVYPFFFSLEIQQVYDTHSTPGYYTNLVPLYRTVSPPEENAPPDDGRNLQLPNSPAVLRY